MIAAVIAATLIVLILWTPIRGWAAATTRTSPSASSEHRRATPAPTTDVKGVLDAQRASPTSSAVPRDAAAAAEPSLTLPSPGRSSSRR